MERILRSVLVSAIILSFCAPSALSAQQAVTEIDLSVPGEISSLAMGINSRGEVVGVTVDASNCERPFLWYDGQFTVFDAPALGCLSTAVGINDRGEVLGVTDPLGRSRGWIREADGVIVDLGKLPGDRGVIPTALNNRGQVVGWSFGETVHAFVWERGAMTDLGTVPGSYSSRANGINDRGQIVGQADSHAVLWDNGAITDLGAPAGFSGAVAMGIDNDGRVVGWSGPTPELHAVAWQEGRLADLGAGSAYAIDDRGRAAGYAEHGATVWRGTEVIDLGDPFATATAINDSGGVAGWSANPSGRVHAVLWQIEGR